VTSDRHRHYRRLKKMQSAAGSNYDIVTSRAFALDSSPVTCHRARSKAMAEDSPKELFEFFQKMWNPMSFPIPGMFQPTMSVEEVEKKIAELRSVENWLKMNLTFVQMTTKTLEMQKSALQSIQESAAARAEKPPKKAKDEGRGTKN
jgi:hypothetical protein